MKSMAPKSSTPNPSLKQRTNGRPRYSSMFIMLPRGLPLSPGVDGMQFCTALRDSPETTHVPVIFVSALGGAQDREAATAAGAVGYVTKPLSSETLIGAINDALSAAPRS